MFHRKTFALLMTVSLTAGSTIPPDHEKREAPCVADGRCPGEGDPGNPPSISSPPAVLPTLTTSPAAQTTTFGCYHGADPSGAQGFCPAEAAKGWCLCSDSSTYAVTTGTGQPCGYTAPPAQGPTVIPTTDCSSSIALSTSAAQPTETASRTPCSSKLCPRICGPDAKGDSADKRSIHPLERRFFNDSQPDRFVYDLFLQPYTINIQPPHDLFNQYFWRRFGTRQLQAGAIQGLCGCTAIFALSSNGAFTSHLWENDENNDPPRDLQDTNFQRTILELNNALRGGTVPQGQLEGGEAFIIVPVDPIMPARDLYSPQVINALTAAVQTSTHITPAITRYNPLDCGNNTLGTNRSGTAAYQFDPKYQAPGRDGTTKAYRIYSEGTVLSERTDL